MKTLPYVLLLLSLCARAQAQSLSEDAIYQGRVAAPDGSTWKSTVGLHYENKNGGGGFCTGVFIESDLIVTAAHCMIKSGGMLNVSMYPKNGTEPEMKYLSGKDFVAYNHPNYQDSQPAPNPDDIAFVLLRNERLDWDQGFETANIFHSGVKAGASTGRTATVAGLGRDHRGELGKQVTFAQGMILGYQGGSIMEVSFSNGQGVCGGDSGGPVFISSGKDLYLAAITTATLSNLPGQSKCGNTLYANVLDADRYNWITRKAEVVREKFRAEKQREEAREAEAERQRKLEEEKKNAQPQPQPPLDERAQLEAERKKLEDERRAFEEERRRFEEEKKRRG